MTSLILAAALLGQCQNGVCQPPQQFYYQPQPQQQIVQIPQKIGETRERIDYCTPLRDFLFGKYNCTPVYQYQPYRIVTPPPQPLYYQPRSYLVPYTGRIR